MQSNRPGHKSKTADKMSVRVVFLLFLSVGCISGIMLKYTCPLEEVYKSCNFYEEYTCWSSDDRLYRVRQCPKRLMHCKSGCFCKTGYVREFPNGRCISAQSCRNQNLAMALAKLPVEFAGFRNT